MLTSGPTLTLASVAALALAGLAAKRGSRAERVRAPSLEDIRNAIRPLGMKVRRLEGEYRVVFADYDKTPSGQLDEEMAAYYTMDATDALETARDMARRRRMSSEQIDEEMAAYYTMDATDALETARDMARRRRLYTPG